MQTLSNTPQGSDTWHAARAGRFCASEAAAAMGVSKYTTRDALLHQKATGITEEVGPAKQRIFDAGHAAEAAARPIADALAGVEFFPAVGVADIDGLPLLASFDGIDMLEEVLWETKMLSQALVAQVQAGELEPHYWSQLEHQLLVSNASRVLFTTSDGTPDGTHHLWYTSRPERRAQVLAAWHQFAKDLAAYVPPEPKAAPVVAAPMETLPAVSVRVDGELAIVSNLPAFGAALRNFIDRIPTAPSTDQEFADTEAACKSLKQAEDALEASENNALAQLVDVDAMRRMVADYRALARATRLQREKLVAQRKEQLRGEIVAGGMTALRKHVDSLNQVLGRNYVPMVHADFGAAIKGKRTIDSLQGAVNDELARAKIEADAACRRIQANLQTLHADGVVLHLFPDVATLVHKQADDFAAVVQARMAQHQAAEQQRMDAERERIRAEEAAKFERAQKDEDDQIESIWAAARRIEGPRVGYVQKAIGYFESGAGTFADDPRPRVAAAVEAARVEMQEKMRAAKAREDQDRTAFEAEEKARAEAAELARQQRDEASAAQRQAEEASAAERAAQAIAQAAAPAVEPAPARACAQPAAPAAQEHDAGGRINLSAINEHLAPIKLDAAGLAALGFEPVGTLKASKLYRASDLARIRVALMDHLARLAQLEAA